MDIRTFSVDTTEYLDMIELRMKVLLEPVGIPRTYINTEKEKHEILIGAFDNKKLIGCCILTHVDETTLQLRQMAVESSKQSRGVGAAIVGFAEVIAREKKYGLLMMHARDAVMDFYKKCGYKIKGQQFFEVGIGHHKMVKELK